MKRLSATYENVSDAFKLKRREFSHQYAHIYAVRLLELQLMLEQRSKEKWGPDTEIRKLSELEENDEKEVVVIGTIYKQQDLKPSILREVSEEHNILPLPPRAKYISDTDELILEDEIQRIRLTGEIDKSEFVTGVICAFKGYGDETGKFVVSDYCLAGLPDVGIRKIDSGTKYVAFVSGLGISGCGSSDAPDKDASSLFALQLMIDFLIGQLGVEETQQDLVKLVRVIIAGDSLSAHTKDRGVLEKAKYLLKNAQAGSVDAVKVLDSHLVQLASGVDVDLMPGEQDPANYLLPQQPFYRFLFEKANHYDTFHCVTNPYGCVVEDRYILGTSGQNITDIYRNSDLTDPIEIMKHTLEWRHMAPTAPDTLGCYPYTDTDPFVIRKRPDIYFSGNQENGRCELVNGTLLVAVPKFVETKSIVLVNLSTLEWKVINFDTDMFGSLD